MTEQQKYEAILRGSISFVNPNGGELNLSQVYSLSLPNLKNLFEFYQSKQQKLDTRLNSDWATLFGDTPVLTKEQERVALAYEILVDIIKLKNDDAKKVREQAEIKKQRVQLLDALAAKRVDALNNLPEEEILKKLNEL